MDVFFFAAVLEDGFFFAVDEDVFFLADVEDEEVFLPDEEVVLRPEVEVVFLPAAADALVISSSMSLSPGVSDILKSSQSQTDRLP